MKRKKTKRQARDEKDELQKLYFKSLDSLVDRLFEIAAKEEYTWCDMARISGIGSATISRLGNRDTKFPQFRTVELLANAFGGRIDYVNSTERKAIVLKWKPEQFSGSSKRLKALKIA